MSDELKKPGEIAQRSGQYEITGPRGGGMGEERTQKLKGSSNRERARKNLVRAHEDIANRRTDWRVEISA